MVLSEYVQQTVRLRPLPPVVGDVAGGVEAGAVAALEVEAGVLPRDSALSQFEVPRTVLRLGGQLALTQFADNCVDAAIDDEATLLGERIILDSQPGEGFEHPVEDRLVGFAEGVEGVRVRLLRKADHLRDILIDARVGIPEDIGRLVIAHPLVVDLVRMIRFLIHAGRGQHLVHPFIIEILQCPSEDAHLLAHVVDVVFGAHLVSGEPMQAHEAVPEDGVARPTDVERAVRVGGSVLDQQGGRLAGVTGSSGICEYLRNHLPGERAGIGAEVEESTDRVHLSEQGF